MNLALVLGQNSESVKPKLISVKDNLNIECFVDLQHFINSSIKRELVFDRVIIVSTLVKSDAYISDLYNYWNRYGRSTEIVMLCRQVSDDNLAKAFLSKFCSTTVTSMSVSSTTLHTLSEAVVFPVSKIAETYGMKDYLAVEVEDDAYEEPKPIIKEPEVQPTAPVIDKKPKEKRSLFGALFGKKKKDDVQESTPESNTQEVQSSIDDSIEEPAPLVGNQDRGTYEEEPFQEEPYIEEGIDEEVPYEDLPEEEPFDEYEDELEFSEEIDETTSSLVDEEVEEDFPDEEPETTMSFADEETDDFDFSSSTNGLDEETVDDDFGDLTYIPSVPDVPEPQVTTEVPEEVEDVVGDLSVANAEEEYRKKTEQPKVIKETVVKEVIKQVKTSTVLENVYKGLAHKLIIVTGDRGSGVTTSAWNLALHFSQHIPVLYFDCDTVNHGLLNYIDYFEFKNYEQSHMQGTKLCRSSKVFNSCVCKWDTNIDILTSDFGVDTSDDELILTQGIVAENLNKYGVVIVDCPIAKLHCVQDLILTGNVVLCVEGSKRGYMNTLVSLDYSQLPLRYKRSIISKGTLLRTHVNKKTDYKRVLKYINSIVDLEDCNWLEMVTTEFNGKVTSELLTEILEG